MSETSSSLARRLWTYQAERFPLGKTALLVAVFSAAGISASAHFAGRPLPGWPAFALAFAVLAAFAAFGALKGLAAGRGAGFAAAGFFVFSFAMNLSPLKEHAENSFTVTRL